VSQPEDEGQAATIRASAKERKATLDRALQHYGTQGWRVETPRLRGEISQAAREPSERFQRVTLSAYRCSRDGPGSDACGATSSLVNWSTEASASPA
jgi:hypothetical protein